MRRSLKIVTTVADDLRVVPEFLRYFSELGVDHFIFNVTDDSGDGTTVPRLAALLVGYRHTIAQVRSGKQSWPEQCAMICEAIRRHCTASDWVLLPDVDELHEYPKDLPAFFAGLDASEKNLVTGELLDRISADGRLPELSSDRPLAEQFPLGCRLSINVLNVPRRRTVAVRGHIAVEKHFATATDPYVVRGIGEGWIRPATTDVVTVHHFKWHSGVVKKLRDRRELYRERFQSGDTRFALFEESDRLLEFLGTDARIDLADPRLQVKALGAARPRAKAPRGEQGAAHSLQKRRLFV